MRRSIEKAVEDGRAAAAKKNRLDLKTSELMELSKAPDVYEAIRRAYWAGLAVGLRQEAKA